MSSTTIHIMKKSTNTGVGSLSGGIPNGTERTFTAVRDTLLDISTGKKHATHVRNVLYFLAYEE